MIKENPSLLGISFSLHLASCWRPGCNFWPLCRSSWPLLLALKLTCPPLMAINGKPPYPTRVSLSFFFLFFFFWVPLYLWCNQRRRRRWIPCFAPLRRHRGEWNRSGKHLHWPRKSRYFHRWAVTVSIQRFRVSLGLVWRLGLLSHFPRLYNHPSTLIALHLRWCINIHIYSYAVPRSSSEYYDLLGCRSRFLRSRYSGRHSIEWIAAGHHR